ncbi:MAG: UbiA family prenyltransferase [Candidatus Thermoplasmatota archaeon]|nr:UbiA family prenyltransferase [Candidatus Thermoplasmatota archaeon]
MLKVSAYARLLRLPGIGALGIVPVIAALTIGISDLYSLTLVFIIGACASVFGFLVNDIVDVELDRHVDELKKKPLVSGEVSKKNGLMITFLLAFCAFFFIALLWYNQPVDYYKFIGMTCIILAGILGTTYDVYGKKIAGSDFLVAISVALIFLFGALSFGQPNVITWIIFLLTFENILYMNAVQNGIKDADHDYKMNVSNIALTSGVKVQETKIVIPRGFQAFGLGLRLGAAVLFFLPAVLFHYSYELWELILLFLFIILSLYFDVTLLSLKVFDRNKIRKIIGVQSFVRYAIVPIMMLCIVDEVTTFLLILVPIVWYIIFTPLLGEKLFKPRM